MKQLSSLFKYITLLLISSLTFVVAFGQDSLSNINIDLEFEPTAIDSGPFYAQLWFWVVIGVIFLLLLIALLRGNGGKKKAEKKAEIVEEKKEVIVEENDVHYKDEIDKPKE